MEQAMKEAFEKMTGMPDAWTNPALMVSRNAFIQGWEAALAQPTSGDYALGYAEGFNDACKPKPAQPAQEHDVDATIIQYHEATIKRLEKRIEDLAQPAQELTNIQRHEQNVQNLFGTGQPADHSEQHLDMVKVQPASKGFLDEVDMVGKFVGDVKANFLDEVKQAQPAQQERVQTVSLADIGAAYKDIHACLTETLQLSRKQNGHPRQPAQEPVFWYRPVAQPGGYEGPLHNSVIEKVRKESGSWKPLYTAPQQRPWVGLTEAQFLEAVRLAENGNYLVAFVRIQEWLKEVNA
jgi:hypothetical protein